MKTVILTPVNSGVDGVVEYCEKDGKLLVNYQINNKKKKGILRLAAMSSKKPNNCALSVDVPDFSKYPATGRAEISSLQLACMGYVPRDIDTFVLFCKNEKGIETVCVGFRSLLWDISYPIDRLCYISREEIPQKTLNLLESIKNPMPCTKTYKEVVEKVFRQISELAYVQDCPVEGYDWHKLNVPEETIELSSVRHLVETERFLKAYQKSRILLVGKKNKNILALALKYNGHNPFDNAEDCALKKGDYWIVGILLEEDGQYFAKIN